MAAAKPANIYEAILAFQKEPPTLEKSGRNPHLGNRFVPLDEAVAKVMPALNALGVTVLQPLAALAGTPALRTILTHAASGTFVEDTTPLVLDKVTPQGQGSAITYARRYALLSFLSLVGEADDDAARAEPRGSAIVAQVGGSAPVSQYGQGDAGVGTAFPGAL